ncbi:hypothetical protein ACTA71_002657 [Dictyostelium dimigraforme]
MFQRLYGTTERELLARARSSNTYLLEESLFRFDVIHIDGDRNTIKMQQRKIRNVIKPLSKGMMLKNIMVLYLLDEAAETKRLILFDKKQITRVLDDAHSTSHAGITRGLSASIKIIINSGGNDNILSTTKWPVVAEVSTTANNNKQQQITNIKQQPHKRQRRQYNNAVSTTTSTQFQQQHQQQQFNITVQIVFRLHNIPTTTKNKQ